MTAHEISEHLAPLRDQFADPRSLVLPALKYAQTDSGWLPPEAMAAVAEATGANFDALFARVTSTGSEAPET